MAKFKLSDERIAIDKSLVLIQDLYDGNYSIDKKRKTYLKRYPGEDDDQYKRRSECSTFYNFLKPSILTSAEKPFASTETYTDDFPSELEGVKTDFDSNRSSLFKFAFNTFVKTLKDGFVGLLSDYDQEKDLPFCRLIPAKDIVGVWSRSDGRGKHIYSRVMFLVRKKSLEVSGAGESSEYREMSSNTLFDLEHPNIVRRYNVEKIYSNHISANFIDEKRLEGFDKLPFHLFKAEEARSPEKQIEIIPPFFDLAKLNLSHYNKQSDQDNIMTVSRFAIFYATGLSPDDQEKNFGKKTGKKSFGPFTVFASTNGDAKFGFAEHTGKAIQAGQNDLMKVEKSMTSLLKDYLQKETFETATEKTINEKRKSLHIYNLAVKLEKVLSEIIKEMAVYLKKPLKDNIGNLVAFSKDYSAIEVSKKIDALIKMRQGGDLSLPTFLREMDNLNVLSGAFDPDKEKELIEQEKPDMPDIFDQNDDGGGDDNASAGQ